MAKQIKDLSEAVVLDNNDVFGLDNTSNISKKTKFSTLKSQTPNGLEIIIDGGGFTLLDGTKTPYIVVPYACTITGWYLRAGASDTFSADVYYAATLGGTPASITGGGIKPNVAAATNGNGTNLASWTTALAKGGVLTVNISGTPAAATWASLLLSVTKS